MMTSAYIVLNVIDMSKTFTLPENWIEGLMIAINVSRSLTGQDNPCRLDLAKLLTSECVRVISSGYTETTGWISVISKSSHSFTDD